MCCLRLQTKGARDSIFRRGVGVDRRSDLFLLEKADVVLSRMWAKVCFHRLSV